MAPPGEPRGSQDDVEGVGAENMYTRLNMLRVRFLAELDGPAASEPAGLKAQVLSEGKPKVKDAIAANDEAADSVTLGQIAVSTTLSGGLASQTPVHGYDPAIAAYISSMYMHSMMAAAYGQTCTTVMLRNVPNRYTRDMLIQRMDVEYKGKYDFVYMPIDFESKHNVGYAFVNFRSPIDAHHFLGKFHNAQARDVLPGTPSKKVCEVSYAHVQGMHANLVNLADGPFLAKLADTPEWQPLFWDDKGQKISFEKISSYSVGGKKRNAKGGATPLGSMTPGGFMMPPAFPPMMSPPSYPAAPTAAKTPKMTKVQSAVSFELLLTAGAASSEPMLPVVLPSATEQSMLMVRGLPKGVTRQGAIDWLRKDYDKAFDFLHVPVKAGAERNRGFMFVNFRTEETAAGFTEKFNQRKVSEFFPDAEGEEGEASLEVVGAQFLIIEKILWRLSNNKLWRGSTGPGYPMEWLPLLFSEDGEPRDVPLEPKAAKTPKMARVQTEPTPAAASASPAPVLPVALPSATERSMLMLRGLPKSITRQNAIDWLKKHYEKAFDFLYLPADQSGESNRGFLFVNFTSEEKVADFTEKLNQKKVSEIFSGAAVGEEAEASLEVVGARFVIMEKILERLCQNLPTAGSPAAEWLPLLFSQDGEPREVPLEPKAAKTPKMIKARTDGFANDPLKLADMPELQPQFWDDMGFGGGGKRRGGRGGATPLGSMTPGAFMMPPLFPPMVYPPPFPVQPAAAAAAAASEPTPTAAEVPAEPMLPVVLPSATERSMLMVRGLPKSATRQGVVDWLKKEYDKAFDFLHVPVAAGAERNRGFLFVNFRSEETAADFTEKLNQRKVSELFPDAAGDEVGASMEVVGAQLDVVEKILWRLSTNKLWRGSAGPGYPAEWLPLLFSQDGEPCDVPLEPKAARAARAPKMVRVQTEPAPTAAAASSAHVLPVVLPSATEQSMLMLRGLPRSVTRRSAIDWLREHYAGAFDFLYLPADQGGESNRGFLFVNFTTEEKAADFTEKLNEKKVSEIFPGAATGDEAEASLQVVGARFVIMEKILERLCQNLPAAGSPAAEWLPLTFSSGGEPREVPLEPRAGKTPKMKKARTDSFASDPLGSMTPGGFMMPPLFPPMVYPPPYPVQKAPTAAKIPKMTKVQSSAAASFVLSLVLPSATEQSMLMLRNLPKRVTRQNAIDWLRRHYEKAFDFLYVPSDQSAGSNRGFLFVNFRVKEKAAEFTEKLNEKKVSEFFPDAVGEEAEASFEVVGARIPSLEKSLERLSSSLPAAGSPAAEWLPLLFSQDGEPLEVPLEPRAAKTPKMKKTSTDGDAKDRKWRDTEAKGKSKHAGKGKGMDMPYPRAGYPYPGYGVPGVDPSLAAMHAYHAMQACATAAADYPAAGGFQQQPRGLRSQVEFYFSTDNLCKDLFLRSKMRGDGYVALDLIAGFKLMRNEFQASASDIAAACRRSKVLELDDEGRLVRLKDQQARDRWTQMSESAKAADG